MGHMDVGFGQKFEEEKVRKEAERMSTRIHSRSHDVQPSERAKCAKEFFLSVNSPMEERATAGGAFSW